MTLPKMWPLWGLGALVLAGCPGKDDTAGDDTQAEDSDTSPEEDSDSGETDSEETDTGESGGETGSGPPDGGYTSYAAVSTVETTFGSQKGCDQTLDVAGTAYTGECAGCTFAFDMAGTVTDDLSGGGCDARPFGNLVEGGRWNGVSVWYWDEFLYDYEGYIYTYGQSMYVAAQFFYMDAGPHYYPNGAFMVFDDSYTKYGHFSFDGTNLDWGYDFEGYYYLYDMPSDVDACGSVSDGTANEPMLEGEMVTGSVGNCSEANSRRDRYTFESDGTGPLYITTDTVDAKSTFDVYMIVTGPDGCVHSRSDDNWACTFQPATYGCAATKAEIPQPGTWTVDVQSYGDCAGSNADYALYVSGGTNLQAVGDDEPIEVGQVRRDIAVSVQVNAVVK